MKLQTIIIQIARIKWFKEVLLIMLQEIINNTNKVYSKLADDLSRKIYAARIMNSLTYNYDYITSISDGFDAMKGLREQLQLYIQSGKKIILDGAGYYGKSIRTTLNDINFECFSDKNATDDAVLGLPVYKREIAARKYPDGVFVITSMVYDREIRQELCELGVENILDFGKYILSHGGRKETLHQYWDVLPFGHDEVIVDVGCFDGDTILKYFEYVRTDYSKIYSFEPEPVQYKNCKEISEAYKDWYVFDAAISDSRGKLYFTSNASCTKQDSLGDLCVDSITLDEFFMKLDKPTFIKMDIEGAEMNALRGCKHTIEKYSPKLAICVYHKPEDIFEIPQYILSINPNYKMYLRHYTNLVNETVLYCVNDEY